MGEEENRNFIHQLLKEERLKTEQKGFGKGFKRCVREKVTDLDGKTIYCLEKSEKEIRQEFVDELMKKIEKKFTQGENTRFSDRNLKYHDGYNEALSDIIEIIKKTIIN